MFGVFYSSAVYIRSLTINEFVETSFPEITVYLLLSGSTKVDSMLIVDLLNLLEYHVCPHRCIYSPRLSSDWNKRMNLIMLADIAYLSTIGGSSLSVIFD